MRPSSMWTMRVRKLVDAGIMGDDQDAALRVQDLVLHEGDDHLAGVPVERSRRLVQDQDSGPPTMGARDGHALLLASRQLHRQDPPLDRPARRCPDTSWPP